MKMHFAVLPFEQEFYDGELKWLDQNFVLKMHKITKGLQYVLQKILKNICSVFTTPLQKLYLYWDFNFFNSFEIFSSIDALHMESITVESL